MAIIINFPSKDAQLRDKLMDKLDEIQFKSDELKNCVKENVISSFQKHNRLPDHSFSIDPPFEISKEQSASISEQIGRELNNYTKGVAQELLMEICLLHIELCKLKLKINQ